MVKDDQEVMKMRAGLISGEKTETKSSDESLLVVEFLLGREKYAIDSTFVREVLSFQKLTQIPRTPKFVAGLLNKRGMIISVINLVYFLNPQEMGVSTQNKILVIMYKQMEFGILADEIIGTNLLDTSSLGIPNATIQGSGIDYIHGVTPDGIILLNAISILSDSKIIINQK